MFWRPTSSLPLARRVTLLGVVVTALVAGGRAPAAELIEQPVFAARVAAKELPPIAERVPAEPLVVDMAARGARQGAYGGTLRIVEGQAKDTRRMVVYGYARLAGYTPKQEIVPDIARAIDVEDGRIFTIHLRKGQRWSDGEPFTADDFRYYWEDIIGNVEMTPKGPPRELMVNGQPPVVTFVDDVTIRYEWTKPNPFFLPALAGAQPLDIFRPAHYLKQFHKKYADPAKLAALVEKKGQRNWVALHFKYDQAYKNANPDMPSLQPWVLVTEPPSDRFIFARNPYFHRIDSAGHQLPYIDEVAMTIASSRLVPAKVGAGEADLQASYLSFGNYAFLHKASGRQDFQVRRWKNGKGAQIALFPNLNCEDPVWRKLFQTADFRRALSVGINREDINQAIYYGLATPMIDTVLPGSPLYDEARTRKWAEYDPEKANALLDGLGLTEKDSGGIRMLPDGRQMMIVVETAGEDLEQIDVLGLIAEDYRKIGIKILAKPTERDQLSRRLGSGATLMSVWTGLENAFPTPDSNPAELAATNSEQNAWPLWGQFYETKGAMGKEPDLPAMNRLLSLNSAWKETIDEGAKAAIWKQMLAINADEAFRIGIVSGVDQVIVVSNRLQNVPQTAIYNWNPGAFFGVYRPDTFFFGDGQQQQADATP